MLSWEYPPRIVGGISPHVHDLSKELARLGLEVHVVTKETPLAPAEETEPSGVIVHRVALGAQPNDFIHEIQLLNDATEVRVRELLEGWRPGGEPTLFHAHDWLSLDSARELKYEYSLPVVATVHATEEGRNGGIHTDMQRYIHEQEYWLTYEAWRVIVCSEFMKEEVNRQFNCPLDKIDVIFNGVDVERFRFPIGEPERLAHRRTIACDDERIVLYVGRFVREKGIHVLLDAAGAILAREPRAKFVVVGGGHREKYEKFSKWYGLADKILFTGFMANRSLQMLYRCADVAVFPSLYEPFGIVALEAMAAGAPVVSSDAGGLKEVILHDQTGHTSYAGNPESLAWAVLRSLRMQEAEREKLVAAAARRLESEFSWPRIASQTAAVYDRVWREFLGSFWAEETLWPILPGAGERARPRKTATRPTAPLRPRPMVDVPAVPATFDHEERTTIEPDT